MTRCVSRVSSAFVTVGRLGTLGSAWVRLGTRGYTGVQRANNTNARAHKCTRVHTSEHTSERHLRYLKLLRCRIYITSQYLRVELEAFSCWDVSTIMHKNGGREMKMANHKHPRSNIKHRMKNVPSVRSKMLTSPRLAPFYCYAILICTTFARTGHHMHAASTLTVEGQAGETAGRSGRSHALGRCMHREM